MNESAPIVLCSDLSESAKRACDVAFAVAGATGRPLRIVHVLNPSPWNVTLMSAVDIEPVVARLREASESALDELVSAASGMGIPCSSEVSIGPPSQLIPERARALGTSLIVMGRRGASNLAHVLIGSTVDRVLRQSPCPVLVVPARSSDPLVPGRVLVGTDFSSASSGALAHTVPLARELNCSEIVIAHVNPPDDYKLGWSELLYEASHPADIHPLRTWVDEQGPLPIDVSLLVVRGETERALLETADREGCGWIAIGSDVHGRLPSFLSSGLARRLLVQSDRPVLVVNTVSD